MKNFRFQISDFRLESMLPVRIRKSEICNLQSAISP